MARKNLDEQNKPERGGSISKRRDIQWSRLQILLHFETSSLRAGILLSQSFIREDESIVYRKTS
jgi:ribosomal protein L24